MVGITNGNLELEKSYEITSKLDACKYLNQLTCVSKPFIVDKRVTARGTSEQAVNASRMMRRAAPKGDGDASPFVGSFLTFIKGPPGHVVLTRIRTGPPAPPTGLSASGKEATDALIFNLEIQKKDEIRV